MTNQLTHKGILNKLILSPQDTINHLQKQNEFLVFQVHSIITGKIKQYYQTSLSDGTVFTENAFIFKSQIDQYNIIRIKPSHLKVNETGKLFAVKEFEVIDDNMHALIGNPKIIASNTINNEIKEKPKTEDYSNNNIKTSNNALSLIDHSYTFHSLNNFSMNVSIVLRVINKSPLLPNKKNPDNKSFKIVVADKEQIESEVHIFGKNVDSLFQIIEEGNLYLIKNPEIKLNSRFKSAFDTDYTIGFAKNTEIEEVKANSNLFPYCGCLKFTDLSYLKSMKVNDVISSLVFVKKIFPCYNTKNGNKFQKATVTSASNFSCEINFFQDQLYMIDFLKENTPVFAKVLKINEFKGAISLQATPSTYFISNPNILNEYFREEMCIFSKSDFAEQKAQKITSGDEQFDKSKINKLHSIDEMINNFRTVIDPKINKYYTVEGEFRIYSQNPDEVMYPACPGCKKKTIHKRDDLYGCMNSNCVKSKEEGLIPDWTYMVRGEVIDFNNSVKVDIFGALSDKIFGRSAAELRELNPIDYAKNIICKTFDKILVFKIKAKNEEYNNILSKKYHIIDIFNQVTLKNKEKSALRLIKLNKLK